MGSLPRRKAAPKTRPSPGKRPYEAGATRRAQIITATIAIIAEHGLQGWKTAEVARRVGISEPTLFRHFKSKRGMLAAAVRHETSTLEKMVTEFEGTGDAWNRAEGLITSILSFLESTGGGPLVILTGQLSSASASTRNEMLKALGVVRQRLTMLFQDAVEERHADGTVQPEDLADLAIAIVQSSALRWVMSHRTYPAKQRARAMLHVARLSLDPARRAP
ncbi:MAG TPA: TetR/AcrR family transcriptional regulator [Gemmatimonadales bacterium]|nr:TetR/AcrR family transcriptional regulator [Gemmatimonadales bacterium]